MSQWPETSESLILRIRDPQDALAWSEFMAVYEPAVYRLARCRVFQHADAEYLCQQVFLSVARAVESWKPQRDGPRFRNWLARVTRNAILNAMTRTQPDRASGTFSVQDLLLGRIGSYEVLGVLRRGGMGIVFKAFDAPLNRFVAIKMLLPHLAASGAARKRFAREGQAVAAVVDDHVMAIHFVDEWQGVPYLVMTYSRSVSLQKRLRDNEPLEVREIFRIGMQAAKGLAAAHAQGIVHRDIKLDVPQWLCSIISKLMVKQAKGRFASEQEAAKLPDDCLAQVQQSAFAPLPKRLVDAPRSQASCFCFRNIGVGVMFAFASLIVLSMLMMWVPGNAEPKVVTGIYDAAKGGAVDFSQRFAFKGV